MGRALRFVLTGIGVIVVVGAVAFWYFLYVPAPAPPQLSGVLRYDSLRVGDRVRSYAIYAPAGVSPRAPVVFALHGSMGSAEQMRRATGYGFERLADRHGFIVVYPQGYDGHWNDCRRQGSYAAKQLRVDDVGFLRALAGRVRSEHGVDSARVFAVGLSNGAHLAYRIALEAPDLVRAVAAVGANLPTRAHLDCTPVPGATPALIINGTADPINPYEGGKVTLFGFGDRGDVMSASESAEYLARRNQRSGSSAPVLLYTVRGGGHTFPQPHARSRRLLGPTDHAFDGPAVIWDFFTRQAGGAP